MITQKQIDDFKRSEAVLSLLKTYSKISPLKQLLWLAFDWAVILGAAAISLYMNSILVYILSVLIISARQHALLVMMHEASHYRISKNHFLNDLISDVFAAYPLLLATATYRKNHLAHHKYTNTSNDPDWNRKIGSHEWHFPKSKTIIGKIMLKQLIFASRDWIQLSWAVTKTDGWKKPVYWAALLCLVTYKGLWIDFTMFWIVPMLTVFPALQRIRSMSEHFGLGRSHELNSSRNTRGTLIERFFFSPHNVNYHLLHHMFPSVPQHHLKDFDEKLREYEIYKKHAHRNDTFVFGMSSVLTDLSKQEDNSIKRKTA